MTRLDYEIVIVTRNRPDALRLSIPLMLSQSRRPSRLIVVDSSDDHETIRKTVDDVSRSYDVPVMVRQSARGMTLQRNVGLQLVEASVVMYPDDDALWFPGVADAMMRVYERDEQGVVGAVCAAESPTAPPGVLESVAQAYQMTWRDRVKQLVAHKRAAFERRMFPDPFHLHGRSRWDVQPSPAWLEAENAVLVEWMTGFRMSFRTELIRQSGFNEAFSDYGMFEDVDASFEVMNSHLIVGARNAQVFHYRNPGSRSNGLVMGMQQVLNRAYIIRRHAAERSSARQRLGRYNWYKCAQYLLECHTAYGRNRLRGAWRATRFVPEILEADDDALHACYKSIRQKCVR